MCVVYLLASAIVLLLAVAHASSEYDEKLRHYMADIHYASSWNITDKHLYVGGSQVVADFNTLSDITPANHDYILLIGDLFDRNLVSETCDLNGGKLIQPYLEYDSDDFDHCSIYNPRNIRNDESHLNFALCKTPHFAYAVSTFIYTIYYYSFLILFLPRMFGYLVYLISSIV
jgi:hypothetical protein